VRQTAQSLLQVVAFIPLVTAPSPSPAAATATPLFETTAYGRQEYTNSITASRDTNLSPAEAYDVIRQRIPSSTLNNNNNNNNGRALDLGAGAGLSTAVLFREKGYHTIDAVDWSRTAWDESVTQQPVTVQFYEMDDASFYEYALQQQQQQNQQSQFKYDAIVYNFACNVDKAVYAATNFLNANGVLLAPVNDRRDYWYKQSYVLLDCTGQVVWKSDPEVGAWSVQFQPDVTSPNCTGIWCGGFNGYNDRSSSSSKATSSIRR